ncbi:36618_t:CDS:2 [Gigaspora margarita]|uniref:36618_t:CDS:1 n=1 Tax=Gigaspora margarita TaxID=4874 RepID=A0ABM8W7A5_GIGMA|nr:36618_t:CDS:2 [Gigaspora margarita]
MIKNGDKKLVSCTLEYIENLENKLMLMTNFDKSLRKRFITNIRAISDQKDALKWILIDKNNIKINIVKTICHSITEKITMSLEYNNLLLSYVVDFSNLPKEIKNAFDEQALITMAAPPIKFYRDMDPTSEKYLEYLYKNQKVCEKLFPQASDARSLFQAICTTKKVYNNKCKLIRFGHDSKNKMLDELIEKKCIYLSDWKNLCNDIRKSELLLFQAYGKLSFIQSSKAKLKVLVLDCPAHPFCRVREVFDLDIPYKNVAMEEFKLFIQALWAIRCALSDIIHDYKN